MRTLLIVVVALGAVAGAATFGLLTRHAAVAQAVGKRAQAQAEEKEVPPADAKAGDGWGTIKGQLVYAAGAEIPERKPLNITKEQEHCLAKGPILDMEWIVNKQNRGVKDVFVWLAIDPTGPLKALPIHPTLKEVPKDPVVVDQPQCMFVPYASVMREGQDLIVKNDSPVAHNANYAGSPIRNKGANPIVPAGKQEVIKLRADRFPVSLSCSIHPWMKARVGVYDHPYFALTDENGNFEMKLAPAGNFRMFVWHEPIGWRLGVAGGQGEPVTIKGGQTNDLGKLEIRIPKE